MNLICAGRVECALPDEDFKRRCLKLMSDRVPRIPGQPGRLVLYMIMSAVGGTTDQAPVDDAEGRIVKWFSVSVDIRDQKDG